MLSSQDREFLLKVAEIHPFSNNGDDTRDWQCCDEARSVLQAEAREVGRLLKQPKRKGRTPRKPTH